MPLFGGTPATLDVTSGGDHARRPIAAIVVVAVTRHHVGVGGWQMVMIS